MNPRRVFLDTNALVSAVVFGGVPGRLVEAARSGAIVGVVSIHVLGELRAVLMRPRFALDSSAVDGLIEEIAGFCEVVAIEQASAAWTVDPADDLVVEAALQGRVDFVATGDTHLLGLKLPGLQFRTPAETLVAIGEPTMSE